MVIHLFQFMLFYKERARRAARCFQGEAVLLLEMRELEFESCSHGYDHLLGSEVTGNFCRDCMRFTRRNSHFSVILMPVRTAPLYPCAHAHFFLTNYIITVCAYFISDCCNSHL